MIPSMAATKASLDKEPKVMVHIPNRNNANYKTERVMINGYPMLIEVGKETYVPKSVYEILKAKKVI